MSAIAELKAWLVKQIEIEREAKPVRPWNIFGDEEEERQYQKEEAIHDARYKAFSEALAVLDRVAVHGFNENPDFERR